MADNYRQVGILAQARGDYEEAERQYHRSLEIFKELGDRVGVAGSYGQLGILAQTRGDYEEAERQYHRSLEIFKEVGDRAGAALTISQLGVLLTERGDIEDAVGYNVRSLAIRLAVGSPDARIDVHWLRRQQKRLGNARFDELLWTQLDETSIANLKDYLSSAATDDQGLQRHLSQWEPVIAAVVAAVEGNDDAAATLQSLLDELSATSDCGALVAVLCRILAGERDEQLLNGLDAVDTAIAAETLHRLAN